MSHHNIEDFKPLSVSPNFGVLARPIIFNYEHLLWLTVRIW